MNLEHMLTEEDRQIRETVREFVKKEIIPNAKKLEADYSLVEAVHQKLVDLGIQALGYPAEYGGGNGTDTALGIICEELAKGDGGIDLLLVNGNKQIVVQVKRRTKGKPSESVSLIREFLGAMLLQDQFRGIYVTTADSFSSESSRAISIAINKGIIDYIDLVDFAKLRDICSLVAYQNTKPWSRFKID